MALCLLCDAGMSHSIFVPGTHAPSATLSKVPGLLWCSAESKAALDEGAEVLIACEGAARGVAVMRNDEGTLVRMFTASSRADVDLAISAVLALAAAGEGVAVNEDDEELDDADEIEERYDADFRSAYVEWGPNVMMQQLEDPDSSLQLAGPWTAPRLSAAELGKLFKKHGEGAQFADAVLLLLVAQQNAARPLHAKLDAGDVSSVAKLPEGELAIEAWIPHQFGTTGAQRVWRVLGGLSHDVLAAPGLLDSALQAAAQMSPDGSDPLAITIRNTAVQVATKSEPYAEHLADRARELATGGEFAMSLVLFDVIVSLPQLASKAVSVSSGGDHERVTAQSSWMCNATWAAQADNNKMPVNAARARYYIERATPYGPVNPPLYFNLACLAYEVGDHPGALRFISLAKQHGFKRMESIANEPLLAPLRSYPQWNDALAGKLS
jgi:hypothetical protein